MPNHSSTHGYDGDDMVGDSGGGDGGAEMGGGVAAVEHVALHGLVARRPATLATCGLEAGTAGGGTAGAYAHVSSDHGSTWDTDSSLEDMRNPVASVG